MNTRPIDEELMRLHEPLVVEDSDPSALDGFTVIHSGTSVFPTGPVPSLHRRSSIASSNTLSSSFSSLSSAAPTTPTPYHSNFSAYSMSPVCAQSLYSVNDQTHFHQWSAKMQSPSQYFQQQHFYHQQQMQLLQAPPKGYGHLAANWSQL